MELKATTTFDVRLYVSPDRASVTNLGAPDPLGVIADLKSTAAEEEFRLHCQFVGAFASVARAID